MGFFDDVGSFVANPFVEAQRRLFGEDLNIRDILGGRTEPTRPTTPILLTGQDPYGDLRPALRAGLLEQLGLGQPRTPGASTPMSGFDFFNQQLQSRFDATRPANPFLASLQQTRGQNPFLTGLMASATGGATPTDLRLFGQGQQQLREGLTQRGLNLSPAGAGIEADFINRFFQDLAQQNFARQLQAGGLFQSQEAQDLNRLLGGGQMFAEEQARFDPFSRALQGGALVSQQRGQDIQRQNAVLAAILSALGLAVPQQFAGSSGGGGGGGFQPLVNLSFSPGG